jgi:hypothetical protein
MIYRVQILGPNFNIGYIWGEIVLLRVSNEFVDIFGMKYYFDMWIQVGSIERMYYKTVNTSYTGLVCVPIQSQKPSSFPSFLEIIVCQGRNLCCWQVTF